MRPGFSSFFDEVIMGNRLARVVIEPRLLVWLLFGQCWWRNPRAQTGVYCDERSDEWAWMSALHLQH
jgi:hypothetical protein